MPLGPGILWTLNGQFFKKNVMKAGTSLGAVQWMNYLQQTDICVDSNGIRKTIESSYFQGEHKVQVGKDTFLEIDGYFKKDDHEYFLEYHGEFHSLYSIDHNQIFRMFSPSRLLCTRLKNPRSCKKTSTLAIEIIILEVTRYIGCNVGL